MSHIDAHVHDHLGLATMITHTKTVTKQNTTDPHKHGQGDGLELYSNSSSLNNAMSPHSACTWKGSPLAARMVRLGSEPS